MTRNLIILSLLWIAASAEVAAQEWSLTLEAETAVLRDQARFTVRSSTGAQNGLDDHDIPHPPALPNRYIDLVSEHSSDEPGWTNQSIAVQRYLLEALAPLGESTQTVNLILELDERTPVSFDWDPLSATDFVNHAVFIEDVSGSRRIDMRSQTFYEDTYDPGRYPFQLSFVYQEPVLTTPTPTLTPIVFASPTPSPAITLTPTPTAPSGRWWELFEYSLSWEELDYEGRLDRNLDSQVNEDDLFMLMQEWDDE